MKAIRPNQRGMASIVIVAVLATILTLISIGFARLMDRSVQDSLNRQISSSANYAAQSGINDAITYLRTNPNLPANSDKDCSVLLNSSALGGSVANLSGDSSTRYSCILINTTPKDLLYSQLPPNQSQVIKMTTATAPAKIMFSWQSSDGSRNALPPNVVSPGLADETAWATKGYEPMLRVSLYPIAASGSLANVQSGARTYFLYPTSDQTAATSIHYSAVPDGSLVPVYCNGASVSGFTSSGGSSDTCNVVVDSFSSFVGASNDYFYVRISPLYGQADVRIQANDNNSNVLVFNGVEANIDVTAKSGSAAKRLQARVDLGASGGTSSVDISPTDNAIPEYALDSARTICKRLNVGAIFTTVDGTLCSQEVSVTPPPLASVVTNPASGITTTGATLSGTINPNGDTVSDCYFQIGPDTSYGTNGHFGCSAPVSGSSPVNESTPAVLASSTTYHFRLCAVNLGGTACGDDMSLTTSSSGGGCTSNCGGGGGGTCYDGIQNGDETGVDTGGRCGSPTDGGNCNDGIKNGNETGVDTGGRCGDPSTGNCHDGVQNGDETGVDSGGRCGSGPGGGGSCTDGIQNGNETGVDTGGRCGSPGGDGAGDCFDGIQNGDETGVDTGGRCFLPTGDGTCADRGDCPQPDQPDCSDSINFTNFNPHNGVVDYSVEIDGDNACGLVFTQCNLFSGDQASGDNHSIAELHDGDGTQSFSATTPDPGGTTFMSCNDSGGNIGYSDSYSSPPPSSPPTVSAVISAARPIIVPQPCAQPLNGSHQYYVCLQWTSKPAQQVDKCTLAFIGTGPDNLDRLGTKYGSNGRETLGFSNLNTSDHKPHGGVIVQCHNSVNGLWSTPPQPPPYTDGYTNQI